MPEVYFSPVDSTGYLGNLTFKIAFTQTALWFACVQMLSGYLYSQGFRVQRARVRAALSMVGPRRWNKTINRRSYKVASPNSLWHIDSHLKLVRLAMDLL